MYDIPRSLITLTLFKKLFFKKSPSSGKRTQAGIYFKALFTTAHLKVLHIPTGEGKNAISILPMRINWKKRKSSTSVISTLVLVGMGLDFTLYSLELIFDVTSDAGAFMFS